MQYCWHLGISLRYCGFCLHCSLSNQKRKRVCAYACNSFSILQAWFCLSLNTLPSHHLYKAAVSYIKKKESKEERCHSPRDSEREKDQVLLFDIASTKTKLNLDLTHTLCMVMVWDTIKAMQPWPLISFVTLSKHQLRRFRNHTIRN